MIRHYCDVCGDEIGWVNFFDLILTDESIDLPFIEDGRKIHRELCKKCASNVAIYIIAKCKDDN